MRYLSLFSGIGGNDLGLDRAGMECVGQVEIDDFRNLILRAHWPLVPKWRDIRKFSRKIFDGYYQTTSASPASPASASPVPPYPDFICGGFPCQDISVAGNQEGITGKRSGLWSEMYRVITEFLPRWLLVENVAALRTNGADTVLNDLERIGYTCWPIVVGAWAVGLPHVRNRVWVVAFSMRPRLSNGRILPIRSKQILPMSASSRLYRTFPALRGESTCGGEKPWMVKLTMGGTTDGVSPRVARLNNTHAIAAYGDAAVPELVQVIGEAVMAQEDLISQNFR
jgi:DNA (cytosine-5)-methyltransferase 1